ncbi:ester cyclase [Novosphingobium sp.]|uniref:ester cyclase n=1 Tax=Novosphingobium sp. TaxID=1874826 RepID=UPI003BAA18F4
MRTSLLTTLMVIACAAAPASAAARAPSEPKAVVQGFLDTVRTGRDPDAVARYFAPQVLAHQITSEGETTVVRTPKDYAAHVREFLATYGQFSFEVADMIAQGDRVFVWWRQHGHHVGTVGGEHPTGAPLASIAAAIYQVSGGRITEYWILEDRKGLDLQLQQLAEQAPGPTHP